MEAKINIDGICYQSFGMFDKDDEREYYHLYMADGNNRVSIILDKKNASILASLMSHLDDIEKKDDTIIHGWGGEISEQYNKKTP